MTKIQAERYMRILERLEAVGFTTQEVDSLLRCSRTLSTWAEHECNGVIQRDGEEGDGKPYWYSLTTHERLVRTSDREAGALRRVKTLCDRHGVRFYHQGDPRGCALYIIRKGDVQDGTDVRSCYTNGVAICID
jgi:hypothetical protein